MDYHAFTQILIDNAQARADVLGLVLAGSTAAVDRQPDQYSDHDFFLITESGKQAGYRQNLDWMPYPERIVMHYIETDHGLKVLYDDAHLAEFAVFDRQEMHYAQLNAYRVVVDKADLASELAQIQQKSGHPWRDDGYYCGQLIAHVLVGFQRYQRGEHLSGHVFIKTYAVQDILSLMAKNLPSDHHDKLDNLDVFRRVEQAYPTLAATLNAALLLPPPDTALQLLAFFEANFAQLDAYPGQAVQAVRDYISRDRQR